MVCAVIMGVRTCRLIDEETFLTLCVPCADACAKDVCKVLHLLTLRTHYGQGRVQKAYFLTLCMPCAKDVCNVVFF